VGIKHYSNNYAKQKQLGAIKRALPSKVGSIETSE